MKDWSVKDKPTMQKHRGHASLRESRVGTLKDGGHTVHHHLFIFFIHKQNSEDSPWESYL